MADPQSNPLDVWIVEDNELLRDTLGGVIDSAPGLRRGLLLGSSEEAIDALEAGHHPDLVLLDLGLPGMSGIEALPAILSRSPMTRVVILTVHDDDDLVFQALCAGASGYLLKSQPIDEIVRSLDTLRTGGAPINARIAQKVLRLFRRASVPTKDYGLSARETEVLELLVEGLTQASIAESLFLSTHTVHSHIRNVYAKLHVRSRGGAVAKAVRERLV